MVAGPIDGLVHCIAGANPAHLKGGLMDALDLEGFNYAMGLSVFSFLAMTRALQPLMREGSSVMAMTYLGAERPILPYNVMGIAKAALNGSIPYLARDLGPHGIRVNAVEPGYLPTVSARGVSGSKQMGVVQATNSLLVHEFSTQDPARVALFLASNLSGSMTGEVLRCDAGYSLSVAPRPTLSEEAAEA